MAHIPDGILTAPVLIGGSLVTAAAVGLALRQIDDRQIPRIAMLSAVFFAGSLISVPVGPSSVHLLFSGLMGILLGRGIFPAVVVALLLQTALFGFGGLTTLGVNALNIALPGALAGAIFGRLVRGNNSPAMRSAAAALTGGLPALATGGMVALSLWLSSSDYVPVASILVATYLPLALAEAAVAVAVVGFLARVQPQALLPRQAGLAG